MRHISDESPSKRPKLCIRRISREARIWARLQLGMRVVTLSLLAMTPFVTGLTASSQQVLPTFFGLTDLYAGLRVTWATPWPAVPFGALRLWDTSTDWRLIEPSRGVYDWSTLDNWVHMAEIRRVPVEFTFGRTPSWAASKASLPPNNMQDWDDLVRAVATRYKGRIEAYEIWNEANSPAFYTGSITQLVTMQQHAFKIIKSIDPAAMVLSPSFVGGGMEYMKRFLTAGGVANFDALAVHLYPWPQEEPVPESRIAEWMNTYRCYMNDFGIGDKPVWDTEYGWGKNKYLPDARSQAIFLARSYLIQWSNQVSRIYWYAYDNDGWGTLRLPNSGQPGTLTEAAFAYKTVYSWMMGSKISRPCAQDNLGTWACELTRSNGSPQVVVWRSSGTANYVAASLCAYEDLHGTRFPVTQNKVTVGSSPILLEMGICRFSARSGL